MRSWVKGKHSDGVDLKKQGVTVEFLNASKKNSVKAFRSMQKEEEKRRGKRKLSRGKED